MSSSLTKREKGQWAGRENGGEQQLRVFEFFFLQRKRLLSKFPANPTVGIRRDKKESCSTRKGLRLDSGFKEFRQTPRGRGFFLLGFYTLFKCYMMFRLV